MELNIKKSTLMDVFDLKDRLREDDINELQALGSNPQKALLRGYIYSNKCYSVFEEDKIIGMFGYSDFNMPKDTCSIWFLGSEESVKHPIAFCKIGRDFIENDALVRYKIAMNRVYTENIKHIKWLDRMGVIFIWDTPIEINGKQFIEFYKIRR